MSLLTRALFLSLLLSSSLFAEEIQGVLSDWKCTERMVQKGREKVLRADRSCSLMRNSARPAYGLIAEDQKYYQFDDAGNQRAKELLNNSHDKDNLRVIVHGQLNGNTIRVETMSIL